MYYACIILIISVHVARIYAFKSVFELDFRRGIKFDPLSKLSMGKGFGPSSVFKYTGSLTPGTQSAKREVPDHILLPDYASPDTAKLSRKLANNNKRSWEIISQTPDDIKRMRKSGRIAREVLDTAISAVKAGMTTDEIDRIVHDAAIERNAYPSPLNYNGYPKSCCTSINEVICHGIPDSTIIPDGCIMNIDVTVFHEGVHGDCSETVLVGNVSKGLRDLVKTTYKSLRAAIAICKPGTPYSDIGGVIEDIITPRGYSSVREFCGHGIGRLFHTAPNVLHFKNNVPTGIMQPGHTFTIEPMICAGASSHVLWPDQWTAATTDGRASAQFEHTLLITEKGVEELTGRLPTSPDLTF